MKRLLSARFILKQHAACPICFVHAAWSTLLAAWSSLLAACCSLLAAWSTLLAAWSSLLVPCSMVLAPCNMVLGPCSMDLAPCRMLHVGQFLVIWTLVIWTVLTLNLPYSLVFGNFCECDSSN